MGRHSKRDPGDSAGRGFGKRHDESSTERFGYLGDRPEPGPGSHDAGYGSQYGDVDRPDYADGPENPNHLDREPDYPQSGAAGSTPPPGVPPRSGPQHSGEWEGGEWTGSHRAVTPGRRGVSVGVIVALVAVVVLVGAVILWRFFGDALSDRTDQAAARCVDGELSVAVVADPNVAEPIRSLADRYNETAAPVADKCVKIGVKPAESDQVVNGFIGAWPRELGDRPALWVPGSSVSAARLEASSGAQTIIDSRSLATSPVVLAVRPQLKGALAQQNWSTLPALQSNPSSLDALNLPGWGSLRLSLPLSGDSDASYLAAEAIAAASVPAGAPPSDGTRAVNTVVAGQPKLADKTTSTAFDALVNAPDPAAAPVHAVAITEQQLYQRSTGLQNAAGVVSAWLPPGPAAIADYPTVLLSGDWLSQEQKSAASEFARFMRKPEQLAELAKAGFRTQDGTSPDSDVVDFGPLPAPLTVGDNQTRALLADTLTAPVANPAVTIMLDQSMPTDEGGQTRLENVVAALNARLQALPASSAVGLWTFDGTAGRSEVSTGPLSDQVDGQPRSAALTSALDDQSASGGGAVSFTTLRLVYTEAMANFRQGQKNSILVITTGPHTDQTLDGEGLQQYIRGAFDEARPVAVNVIDFGSDSDRATWEAVAEISGGSYQNLASSDSPELTAAIANFLG
ncbi:hypothetical protein AU193_06810 [Mycobacterium sp. GA-1285]|uniref:substrate-binding domain-containing protein n=1 Tax=Mycobacterium sp. GA-1285 TaxID=1772282 RepID=UPI000746CA07|nr:substrate-binding domain-containing protein [Mycobacterium sp. GA-1285]KUI20837.1 hypothetical protein AU193_06810 [Mycobacterium sp. GA-1285]